MKANEDGECFRKSGTTVRRLWMSWTARGRDATRTIECVEEGGVRGMEKGHRVEIGKRTLQKWRETPQTEFVVEFLRAKGKVSSG